MSSPFSHLFAPSNPIPNAPPPAPIAAPPSFAPPAGPPPAPIAAPPSFGAPAPGTPPPAPISAPAPMPSFGAPPSPVSVHPNALQLATLLPAILGSIKDPVVLGAALAGFHRGQDAKRARLETEQQRDERRALEQADFYTKALTEASQFDDLIAFEHWKQAITPMARLRGVDPGVFTFNNDKKAAKDKKLVSDALDVAVRQHGPEVLNRDDVSLQLSDGRTISMKTARQMVGGGLTDAAGAKVDVPGSVGVTSQRFVATIKQPDGTFKKVYAFEDPKTRKVTDASGADITAQIVPPETASEGKLTPEEQFYQQAATEQGYKDFKSMPTAKQLAARQKWSQVDDRAAAYGGLNALYGEIDPQAMADAIERGDQPPDISSLGRPAGAAVSSILAKKRYNLSAAITDWKATQKHIQTMNGPQQLRLNQSINSLPGLLDSVDALASKWKGGRFPILNRVNLAAAKGGAYGEDVATVARQLESQIADVVSDLGNVYMGGNSPTDHALDLAGKSLSGDWSEKVLHDMVALAKSNVIIRKNSIANTGVAGASADNPYAPPAGKPNDPLGIR